MNKALSALAVIQSKIHAPKGQRNKFGGYNYRSCEDILQAVKPLLEETCSTIVIEDELVLIGDRYYIKATVVFIDLESSESIKTTAYAREEESKKGMDGSQVTGASSSYARKYALNGLLLIDDTKDSDATNEGEAPEKKDDLNYEVNSGSVGTGKPEPAKKGPPPAPAPAKTVASQQAKTQPADRSAIPDPEGPKEIRLDEKAINTILKHFEQFEIEVWDMEKVDWVGKHENWTQATRGKLLKVWYAIQDSSDAYSKEDFLAGKLPV